MEIKVYTVSLAPPRWLRRLLVYVALPIGVVVGAATAVHAGVTMIPFSTGTKISSLDVNSNFKALGDAVNALQGQVGQSPPGTIIAFGGKTCPSGTVAANGATLQNAGTYANLFKAIGTTYGSVDATTFILPNAQGVFLRGAGTQSIGPSPPIPYSATLGATQGDQFQGHYHKFAGNGIYNAQVANMTYGGALNAAIGATPTIQQPSDDGTNGAPRTGAETRPANIGVLYCIWY
jgi:microcystin-dependent protein